MKIHLQYDQGHYDPSNPDGRFQQLPNCLWNIELLSYIYWYSTLPSPSPATKCNILPKSINCIWKLIWTKTKSPKNLSF